LKLSEAYFDNLRPVLRDAVIVAGTGQANLERESHQRPSTWAPPTINCDELDPKYEPLNLIRQRIELRPEFVMTHAIGFSGYYYAAQVLRRGSSIA